MVIYPSFSGPLDFTARKMDLLAAAEIVTWEYPPPYELYSLHNSPRALLKLMGGHYFAFYLQQQLVGFFCYGSPAQLAGKKGHQLYQNNYYLDIGLGMHPGFCGRGLGVRFVAAGLEFACKTGWSGGFRLTVASNNVRAQKVYLKLGFRIIGSIVWDLNLTGKFLVLTLDNYEPVLKEDLPD